MTEGRVWHSRQRETKSARPCDKVWASARSRRALATRAGEISGAGAKLAQPTINRAITLADAIKHSQRVQHVEVVAAALLAKPFGAGGRL
ncbi:MAG: hypothetical protein DME45_00810 [Verrucomicrobia bacterium]|nr:MAG: hypothetical protein DME45_00810 [Verrucomicrobiota bacterium]